MARKDEIVRAHATKISEYTTLCEKGTPAELAAKMKEIEALEEEYLSIHEKDIFKSLEDVHAAFVMHHFETISHKEEKEQKRLTGLSRVDKTIQINLKKFTDYKGISPMWYYELQALNKRLTMRVAESLGVTPAEVRAIDDSFAMDGLARAIELGETPLSDAQCVKHMQKVLDTLAPSTGRVNGYDLAYVMAGYTKRAKKTALVVQCSKHGALMSILGDVFHRIATKGVYDVDYKRTKVAVPATTAEPNPAKPAKAKKSKKPAAVAEDTIVVKREEVAA